jgi:large subunit ribosomal protein L25
MLEVELGGIVHLSDITLPEGAIATALELGDDHDLGHRLCHRAERHQRR